MQAIRNFFGQRPGRRPEPNVIVGILPDASSTETLLNNLSEADFDLSDVSVVMNDVGTRNAIAKDAGPLKGSAPADVPVQLVKLGISQQAAQRCSDGVVAGKVVVVMSVPAESAAAAREMLTNHSAELVQE